MFVPIFYFCSGYTYSMKGTFKECMKKRLRKLFVPYLFYSILMFIAFMHFSLREVLGVFYSRYCLYPLTVSPNIKFMTSGNYPMWFLTSMIVSYFFFYLIVYYEKIRYCFLFSYVIITVVLTRCPILLPWSIDTAFLTALFMYAGMLVRKKNYILADIWQVGLLVIAYVGLQLIGGDINLSVRMYGTSVIIYFVLGCLGSYVVLWVARRIERTFLGNIFLSLGRHSMTIFCIQMFFIYWAKTVFHYFFPQEHVPYYAGIFEVIIALSGGWMVSKLIHRSHFLDRHIFQT